MTRIDFRLRDGSARTIEASDGSTIMREAVNHGVPGIIGECGGQMSCATCHVYLDDDVIGRIAPASADEADLLSAVDGYQPNSRLGCQVRVSHALDGTEVEVAPEF